MEVLRHEDVSNDFKAQFSPEIIRIPGKVKSEAGPNQKLEPGDSSKVMEMVRAVEVVLPGHPAGNLSRPATHSPARSYVFPGQF